MRHIGVIAAAMVLAAVFCVLPLAGGVSEYAAAAESYTETVDGVTYTYDLPDPDADEASITSADLNGKTECIVPQTLGGHPVTDLRKQAFSGKTGLKKVALPDGIKTVEVEAFDGCTSLEEIDIATTTKFVGEPVQMVNRLYVSFLGRVPSLMRVEAAEDNPRFKAKGGILFSKDGTELIVYPAAYPGKVYEVPAKITRIEHGAFCQTQNLEEIRLDADLIRFAHTKPFAECAGIKTVNLISGGEYLIRRNDLGVNQTLGWACGLEPEEFKADGNSLFAVRDGVLYSADMTALAGYPAGKDADLFIVPDGTKYIKYYAFYGSRIKAVDLPGSLESIDRFAFRNCTGLETVTIPNLVARICGAFSGCTSLREIVIPPRTEVEDEGVPAVPEHTVIKGEEGSCAQKYASKTGRYFEAVTIERYENRIEIPSVGAADISMTCGQAAKEITAYSKSALTYTVSDESILRLSQTKEGRTYIEPLKAGTATVTVTAEADDAYKDCQKAFTVRVGKAAQSISVEKTSISGAVGKKRPIGASAEGALSYKSSNTAVATVSKDGAVTFRKPGTATVTITAAQTDTMKAAKRTVTVKAFLAAPKLYGRAKRNGWEKRGKVKLTWNKVQGATQVQLYVRYPGTKKYQKVMTRTAKLKSVTHKGLRLKKRYRYKVRVRTKVGGKYVYSRFSNVISVRCR